MIRKIFEVAGHCLYQSIRHPRTRITQLANPEPIKVSPIPWWGSSLILVAGITSWCLSSYWNIEGLGELSRAMVWLPLMHLFDMSWSVAQQVNKGGKK
ncbi:MAG: hypothetical protein Q8N42_02105 [bacterium]|nr:hypothetical protein [bacterium]